MKEYHDANVRITEQEEQTEKEVAERAENMTAQQNAHTQQKILRVFSKDAGLTQCKVPWLMRWMI